MDQDIRLGRYQHYKGNFYEVLGVCHHSETLEKLVLYRALYEIKPGEESLWVRPFEMFFDNVNVNDKSVPRFKFISNN